MDWTELEPDSRLTFLIGDIVRGDVFAEGESGSVFQVIAAASKNPAPKPIDLSRLLHSAKRMLRELQLDDFAREMTRTAIIETKAAHEARNGPVHDRWMHQGAQDERWISVGMLTSRVSAVPPTPQNLSTFLACRNALHIAAWRMRGVSLILPTWLGGSSFLDQLEARDRYWWTAVALGRFTLPEGAGTLIVELDESLPLGPAH